MDADTIEKIVLLAENTGDAVHEITTQSKCERFVSVGEKSTCARHVDGKNVALLELFQSRFGAEGRCQPATLELQM